MGSMTRTAADVKPITPADLKRAAMWGLKLPAAPVVEAAPEVPPSDPGESWETWTDEMDREAGRWTIVPDADEPEDFIAQPLPVVSVELIDLVEDGFAYRYRLAMVSPTPGTLAINGFVYSVAPIPIDPSIGSVAFEVHKVDANVTYHVHKDGFGEVRCSCPDFEFRRAGSGRPCKHGAALIAKGLIPTVAVEPGPVAGPGLAGDDESAIDLTDFASRMGEAAEGEVIYHGVKGRWVPITPQASVFRPSTIDRIDYPAPRRGRYVPSPDERAEAAQLFGDLAAADRESYRAAYAAAL